MKLHGGSFVEKNTYRARGCSRERERDIYIYIIRYCSKSLPMYSTSPQDTLLVGSIRFEATGNRKQATSFYNLQLDHRLDLQV